MRFLNLTDEYRPTGWRKEVVVAHNLPLPEDGKQYVAHPVTEVFVTSVGTSWQLECVFMATVEGFGDKLWPVVITRGRHLPRKDHSIDVRFEAAAYYMHSNDPRYGRLHDDARFFVIDVDGPELR